MQRARNRDSLRAQPGGYRRGFHHVLWPSRFLTNPIVVIGSDCSLKDKAVVDTNFPSYVG